MKTDEVIEKTEKTFSELAIILYGAFRPVPL